MTEHRCKICGRVFLLKSSLKVHLSNHKRYGVLCDIDNSLVPKITEGRSVTSFKQEKGFTIGNDQETVQNFGSVNTGREKTHECPFCGKLYALKVNLKIHLVNCKLKQSNAPSGTVRFPSEFQYSVSEPCTVKTELEYIPSADEDKFDANRCSALKISVNDCDLKMLDYPGKEFEREKIITIEEPVNDAFSSDGANDLKDFEVLIIPPANVLPIQSSNKSDEIFGQIPDCIVLKVDTPVADGNSHQYVGEVISQGNTTLIKKEDTGNIASDCSYMCMVCDKDFSSIYALKKHMESNSHPCNICNVSFQSCSVLKNHINTHHEYVCATCDLPFFSEAHKCKFCSKQYDTCENLSNHKKTPCLNSASLCKEELHEELEPCLNSETVLEEDDEEEMKPRLNSDATVEEEENEEIESGLNSSIHFDEKHKEMDTDNCESKKSRSRKPTCLECKSKFASRTILQDHLNKESYKCNFCKKVLSSCSALKTHKKSHRKLEIFGSKKPTCLKCKGKFSSYSVLQDHLSKGSYKCNICKKVFSLCNVWKSHRKSHLKSQCDICLKKFKSLEEHLGKDYYECNVCFRSFASCKLLVEHRNTHYSNRCLSCYKKFATKDLLTEHTMQTSYQCEICGIDFLKCKSVKLHMPSHNIRCKVCGSSFIYPENLKEHESRHTDADLTCKYCKMKFNNLRNMKRHIDRVHYGTKDVQCDFCGKMFHKSSYLVHRRIHTGERPYECKVCKARFVQLPHLNTHIKIHAEGRDQDLQCDFCSKAFRSKQELTIHQRVHTGERPFDCDQCPRKFKSEKGLKIHIKSHNNDDTAFSCSVCLKEFRRHTSLNEHYRTHSQEELMNYGIELVDQKEKIDVLQLKRFYCKYCSQGFDSKTKLRYHELHHTGEKPHRCSYCEKTFRLSNALAIHERIHTGERPFKCNICNKTFNQQHHLKVHMENHGKP